MNPTPTPLISDIVLIGGGHAHVHLLKMFGMAPNPSTNDPLSPVTFSNIPHLLTQNGIRTTLITSDTYTPYSGMLPGMVAGHYTKEEMHLDLRRLCRFGNVRMICATAIGIRYDTTSSSGGGGGGWVECSGGRPDVRFDVLSLDVGSSPSIPRNWVGLGRDSGGGGGGSSVTPVKPIAGFARRWENICHRFRMAVSSDDDDDDGGGGRGVFGKERPFRLLVVGGGAGGVELALAAQHALQNIVRNESSNDDPEDCIKVTLATRGKTLLTSHSPSVQKILIRILTERNIDIRTEAEAIGVSSSTTTSTTKHNQSDPQPPLQTLQLSPTSSPIYQTQPIQYDECLWCTSAGAAGWLRNNTPLDVTDDGFVKVGDTYESVSHKGVFAAGDCCCMVENPRPKAGVFAVRAGPYLLQNLIATLLQKPLTPHLPQSEFLGLISTGNKYAVASRGSNALEGEFLWTLKDKIDRTWMNMYLNLPDMEEEEVEKPASLSQRGPDAVAAFAAAPMRCGGCGAKVGARTLNRVLNAVHKRRLLRAGTATDDAGALKIDYEDAAVVKIPEKGGGAMVYTIDFFRSFVSDPFVFGKIAAVHALSDCHAMGAAAQTALALAVVPFSAYESITEATLIDMLSGASDILDADSCALSGGHTCEGSELALGFSVNGYIADPSLLFRKRGGRVGDKIVITKPIGTGAVFAADMRAKCRGEWVEEALKSMMISNRMASRVAIEMQKETVGNQDGGIVHACTDVTGFGLIGHLLEMLDTDTGDGDDDIGATINISAVPFFKGALEASSSSIVSSLHRENFRCRRSVLNHAAIVASHPIRYPLLFDPQTAGGLLFFVAEDKVEEFVNRLTVSGGTEKESVAVIGEVTRYERSQNDEGDGVDVCGVGDNSCGVVEKKFFITS